MFSILLGVLSLILIGCGLFYFLATTGFGVFEGRRLRRLRDAPAVRGEGPRSARRPRAIYVMVPCLNEEGVIGSSLTRMLRDDDVRVVIIDDGSTDHTADIVRAVGGDRTLLISRRLPDAQKGKGPALNAGLPAIIDDVKHRGLDPFDVIVCVMDADGELSDGALKYVLPLFEDPKVGGAQLGVRISNRDVSLLTMMQDFEFWGMAATAQLGRVRLGTVSLGGNGQFTRLSALADLGTAPWSTALTEDLDLALRLMTAGWRLTTTPKAYVNQQAVLTLPALIRQRTRWFQGHMACIGRLRSLWSGPAMSNLAVLEVSAYLLIPWMFILPWSILFHIGLWELVGRLASAPRNELGGSGLAVRVITLAAWYLLGFGPSLFGGYLYYRQDRSVSKLKAFAFGHALVLCNYVAFVSCWLAAIRSLRGLTGWEKTFRRTERGLDYLLPATALAGASGRVRGRLRRRPPDPRPVPLLEPVLAAARPSGAPVLTMRFAQAPRAAPAPAQVTSVRLAAASTPVTVRGLVARHDANGGSDLPTAVDVPGAVSQLAPVRVAVAAPALTGRLQMSVRARGTNGANALGGRFLTSRSFVDNLAQPDGERA